jgi:amino acid transporter
VRILSLSAQNWNLTEILLILPVTGVNFAAVRFLGEVEFWTSSVKLIALIGLILFGILVDVGVNPRHQTIGFENYRPPYGPFGSYLEDRVGTGDTSRFLGIWSVMSAYFWDHYTILLSKCILQQMHCLHTRGRSW